VIVDPVRQIAQAVLYEGYLLWPYRRSARKNQQRWTLGGVFPEPYSAARGGDDASLMQTQCLLAADPTAGLDVRVRFLHVVARDIGVSCGAECGGELELVPELAVGDERYLAGEETTEREAAVVGLTPGGLLAAPHREDIEIPAGRHTQWLAAPGARRVGVVLRSWQAVRGRLEILAESVSPGHFLITVRVSNTTPWCGAARSEAVKRALVSAHTILHTSGGRFVSLMDPPARLRRPAANCRNIGTWPVLVGAEGERHTMLSSPIILYDYPQVAPESPGDLFDATEIDQLLTLSILTLTDEERREARDGDPRARELLDRCAALSPEQLMRLSGTFREIRELPAPSLERPA
jgi:hypothetical protein